MRTVLFLLLFGLSVNIYAQTEVITVFEAVKIENEKRAEALYFYENNWKSLRKKALQKGFIHSFEFIVSQANENADFDIILLTRYKNQAQFEKAEENFQALIKERGDVKLKNELKPDNFRRRIFVKNGKSALFLKSNK